jgi:hypothetical protein
VKENADLLSPLIGGQMTALGLDPTVFLSFGLGVFTALLGVAAKCAMDHRLAKRRLEMDERVAITKTMGQWSWASATREHAATGPSAQLLPRC